MKTSMLWPAILIVFIAGDLDLLLGAPAESTDVNKGNTNEVIALSNDFFKGEGVVSKRALEKLEERKEVSVLVMGLQHHDIAMKLRVVDALQRLDDKSVLPALIDTLEAHNVVAEGSSDTVVPQQKLKENLVLLISKMAGKGFQVKDYDNTNELHGVIRSMRSCIAEQKRPANVAPRK